VSRDDGPERDLEAVVARALARGRETWPTVDVDAATFATFLKERLSDPSSDLEPHEDLYLACACLSGVAGAREVFEEAIMRDVPTVVRRISTEADFIEDVVADLRLSLLGGTDGRPPSLESYRGRGPLRSFVLVLAMRRAVDRTRRKKEVVTEPDALPDRGQLDPGIARVDAADLRIAFLELLKEKLLALPTRERTILRLHIIDEVPAEAIGKMYGVHRATATRWIAQARELVFTETRDAMQARFKLSPATFASFARDDALGLDAQLSTFLGGAEVDP